MRNIAKMFNAGSVLGHRLVLLRGGKEHLYKKGAMRSLDCYMEVEIDQKRSGKKI